MSNDMANRDPVFKEPRCETRYQSVLPRMSQFRFTSGTRRVRFADGLYKTVRLLHDLYYDLICIETRYWYNDILLIILGCPGAESFALRR